MQSEAGRELYERGWRQGCLIPLRPTQTVYESVDPPSLTTLDLDAGVELVLATQDCDLVKPTERLPYVEAIAATRDTELSSDVQINDGRYFVLDPEDGLVADRVFNATLHKEALLALAPPDPPCAGDTTRARRFGHWLGLRYDRIPLPDAAVEHIQIPLANAFRKLCRRGRPYEALNRQLREIRVVGNLSDGPPFLISLIFVLEENASIEDASEAIAAIIVEAGLAIEGAGEDASAVAIRRWVPLPPSLLSVKAYQESIPVSLERLSMSGEEIVGALPLDAESA